MSEFEGFGRDLQAAFDASGDTALAQAFKAFVVWFSGDGYEDGLWSVTTAKDENGASIAVSLVKANAYEAPVFPSAVELSAEQTAAQAVKQDAPVDAPVADAAPEVAAPADPSSSGSDVSSVTSSDGSPADAPAA